MSLALKGKCNLFKYPNTSLPRYHHSSQLSVLLWRVMTLRHGIILHRGLVNAMARRGNRSVFCGVGMPIMEDLHFLTKLQLTVYPVPNKAQVRQPQTLLTVIVLNIQDYIWICQGEGFQQFGYGSWTTVVQSYIEDSIGIAVFHSAFFLKSYQWKATTSYIQYKHTEKDEKNMQWNGNYYIPPGTSMQKLNGLLTCSFYIGQCGKNSLFSSYLFNHF